MTYQMQTRVGKRKPDDQICGQVVLWQSHLRSRPPRTWSRAPPPPPHCPQVPVALWGSARAPSFHQGLPWARTPQSARFPQSLPGALPKFKHLRTGHAPAPSGPDARSAGARPPLPEQRVLLLAHPAVPPGPEVLVGFPPFPRKGVFVWRLLNHLASRGRRGGPKIQGSAGGGGGGVLLSSSSLGSRVSSPTARVVLASGPSMRRDCRGSVPLGTRTCTRSHTL